MRLHSTNQPAELDSLLIRVGIVKDNGLFMLLDLFTHEFDDGFLIDLPTSKALSGYFIGLAGYLYPLCLEISPVLKLLLDKLLHFNDLELVFVSNHTCHLMLPCEFESHERDHDPI